MNKRVKTLYVIVFDNKVVAFGNLKDTIDTFTKVEAAARNYQFYYREFKKNELFKIDNYTFQKLL